MPQAIRIHETGGPEVMVLEEVAVGAPGPGEARVRHTAIGVNYIDTYHRSGLYKLPLPAGIGTRRRGRGRGGRRRRRLAEGRAIASRTAAGRPAPTATERVMPADRLVKIPDGDRRRVAATLMLKGLTVQYLFRQTYPLKGGETILFHAAAGGVGLIACQWARALGVTMIGTVGSDEKAALAKANGCAHTIVYTRENFVARTKELTGGKGVPVVYDAIGKDTFPQSLDCLPPRGMFVSYGNASGPVPPFDIMLLSQKGSLYATRPTLFTYAATRARLLAMADELFALVLAGKIKSEARQTFRAEGCRGGASRARVARDDRRDGAAALAPQRLRQRLAALVEQRARGVGQLGRGEAERADALRDAARRRRRRAGTRRSAAPSSRSMPCASSAPSNPDSTSPVPAVASAGLPLALMSQVPSGCASTLPAPFSTTLARKSLRELARGARCGRAWTLATSDAEQRARLRRDAAWRASARCAPRSRRSSAASRAIRLSASASSASGNGSASARCSSERAASLVPRPGPHDQRIGLRVEHARRRGAASVRACRQSTLGGSAISEAEPDLARAGAQRRAAGEDQRADHAVGAAEDAERAERALVHVARAAREHRGQRRGERRPVEAMPARGRRRRRGRASAPRSRRSDRGRRR